ncbi:MAG: hypothetical protein EBS70_04110 [Actinobacteria bacterium]|nr:hypothetical protein [Actinomycetota bacterium]
MYKAIAERRSVRKLYVETLVKRGDITVEEAETALNDFNSKLQGALDETRASAPETIRVPRPPAPIGVLPHVPTGVDRATLDRIFAHLTDYPAGFAPHPKLVKQFEVRAQQYAKDADVDWATGEAMAIGSLVLEGTPYESVTAAANETHIQRVHVIAAPGSAPAGSERVDIRFWVEDLTTGARAFKDTIFNGRAN